MFVKPLTFSSALVRTADQLPQPEWGVPGLSLAQSSLLHSYGLCQELQEQFPRVPVLLQDTLGERGFARVLAGFTMPPMGVFSPSLLLL